MLAMLLFTVCIAEDGECQTNPPTHLTLNIADASMNLDEDPEFSLRVLPGKEGGAKNEQMHIQSHRFPSIAVAVSASPFGPVQPLHPHEDRAARHAHELPPQAEKDVGMMSPDIRCDC